MAERTESNIIVAASPSKVMAVVADLAAYPTWSHDVKSVEVLTAAGDGRPAVAKFVVDAGPIKDTYELAYEWDADRAVSWTLVSGSLMKAMDGSYELIDNGDGTTTVVYRLAVDVSIPMIGLIKRKVERAIVDTALRGLKEQVEAT